MSKKSRAANGEGSVFYDESKKAWIASDTVSVEGEVQRRKNFTGKTRAEAIEKRRVWREGGSLAPLKPNMTVSEWGEEWLKEYVKKLERSTASNYPYTFAHIKKHIGSMRVKDIKAAHVEKLLDDLKKEYSASTVKKVRAMLGQILRKAEANELIKKNPVPLADRTRFIDPDADTWTIANEREPWTDEEVEILMRDLPRDLMGHSIRLFLATGLRPQEMIGLSSFNISEDGSKISVFKAIKRAGKQYVGKTKSRAGQRIVNVPPAGIESALFLRRSGDGFIFKGKFADKPLCYSTYLERYKESVSTVSGVRMLTPHCNRHTWITAAANSGASIKAIMKQSGHNDERTNLGYQHEVDEDTKKVVDAIEKVLSKKSQKDGATQGATQK